MWDQERDEEETGLENLELGLWGRGGGGVFRDESEDLWIIIETRTGTWIKNKDYFEDRTSKMRGSRDKIMKRKGNFYSKTIFRGRFSKIKGELTEHVTFRTAKIT
jgi:hypothetical protein